MTSIFLPTPRLRDATDGYGFARMPRTASDDQPRTIDKIQYGRFRNVYLYITEACQLRCQHCYMGERLDRAKKMSLSEIEAALSLWRKLGGSKLTILGGEPTLHPNFVEAIRRATELGYEHVITTTNAQRPAARKLDRLTPMDFAYVQVSLDGGSAASHDCIPGQGTFDEALTTTRQLVERGFDTRIICTVNRRNQVDALNLLRLADELGVSLVKFHVFSTIGIGAENQEMAMTPPEWIAFYEELERVATDYQTRAWYQPTFARTTSIDRYSSEGYQGCIGRTLDRISIFPDGRCYVCSYLFDTDLHFAQMRDGAIDLNPGANEFNLFTSALTSSSCGDCKEPQACQGGCPAEAVVGGASSCAEYPNIVPVCRLWKSSAS